VLPKRKLDQARVVRWRFSVQKPEVLNVVIYLSKRKTVSFLAGCTAVYSGYPTVFPLYLYWRFYWALTMLQHPKPRVFAIDLRLYNVAVWGGPPQIPG